MGERDVRHGEMRRGCMSKGLPRMRRTLRNELVGAAARCTPSPGERNWGGNTLVMLRELQATIVPFPPAIAQFR